MTRMTGPDCAVRCSLINIHTYIRTCVCVFLCVFQTFVEKTLEVRFGLGSSVELAPGHVAVDLQAAEV